jgi:hypothetical protein
MCVNTSAYRYEEACARIAPGTTCGVLRGCPRSLIIAAW